MNTRRSFLQLGGAAVLGFALAACSDDDGTDAADQSAADDATTASPSSAAATTEAASDSTVAAASTTAAATSTGLTAADFESLGVCQLTPEQTEGPFYLDSELVRQDITEGLTGHPLRLGIRVVDASCAPLPGAVVDIWHCDVDGDYSAFDDGASSDDGGAGTTFLRGSLVADDAGIVEFATNYPGWYTGRAVHIHCKVHLDGSTALTSQLYFAEDYTDQVHAEEPYAARGTRDTRNETDAIAGDPAASGNLVNTSADGTGTLGLVVLGVEPQ
jgi:protocatechuate 3,4-dioxygenase beta subunit